MCGAGTGSSRVGVSRVRGEMMRDKNVEVPDPDRANCVMAGLRGFSGLVEYKEGEID